MRARAREQNAPQAGAGGFKSTPASSLSYPCSCLETRRDSRPSIREAINRSSMTKQSSAAGAAAVVGGAPVVAEKAAVGGHGVEATTTEEQARAIICMAKRAVEEEAAKAKIRGDGAAAAAAGEPSLKRSLECFLEGRKNRRRRLESSSAASSTVHHNPYSPSGHRLGQRRLGMSCYLLDARVDRVPGRTPTTSAGRRSRPMSMCLAGRARMLDLLSLALGTTEPRNAAAAAACCRPGTAPSITKQQCWRRPDCSCSSPMGSRRDADQPPVTASRSWVNHPSSKLARSFWHRAHVPQKRKPGPHVRSRAPAQGQAAHAAAISSSPIAFPSSLLHSLSQASLYLFISEIQFREEESTKSDAAAAAAGGGEPVVEEKAAVGVHGVEATITEQQGKAIISMAKRAVEEEAAKAKTRGDGGAAAAGEPSLKRSLECFLESRKKAASSAAKPLHLLFLIVI
ncbi:hypothetical protein HU200_043040 [Digitaria exilis]|uniref:Uncharacterized protein n=1 Tax=Digitaria exilis TaxID=1010633 RepID=A0A835B422_9POAL|nr:hypothetical protein HU200_043040 [Digitaria exilis]